MNFQKINVEKKNYTEEEIFNMIKNKRTFNISLIGRYEKEAASLELLSIKKEATNIATSSLIKMNKNRVDETLSKLIKMYEKIIEEETSQIMSILLKVLGEVNTKYVLENKIRYSVNWQTKTLTIN